MVWIDFLPFRIFWGGRLGLLFQTPTKRYKRMSTLRTDGHSYILEVKIIVLSPRFQWRLRGTTSCIQIKVSYVLTQGVGYLCAIFHSNPFNRLFWIK